jgi:hypothetical protein
MISLANEIQLAQQETIAVNEQIQNQLKTLEKTAQAILDELVEATTALGNGISFSMISTRLGGVQSNTFEKINLPHAFFRIFLKDCGNYDVCLLIDGSYWIASGYGGLNHTQLSEPTIEAVVENLKRPILKQSKIIADRQFKSGNQ